MKKQRSVGVRAAVRHRVFYSQRQYVMLRGGRGVTWCLNEWQGPALKVTLVSVADLREYFGREPEELQLPEDATLHSLLQAVNRRWGPKLPAYMWDSEQCAFRGPILLLVDKKVVLDHSTALCDGQEVTVLHALAGG